MVFVQQRWAIIFCKKKKSLFKYEALKMYKKDSQKIKMKAHYECEILEGL